MGYPQHLSLTCSFALVSPGLALCGVMGGSASKSRYQIHVIIVGGGYAGVTAATQLDQYCQVTLIDPKDAFHHAVGSLRSVVEPSFIKKILIPYENSIPNGTFIQAKCVSVHLSLKKVTLSDGQELEYDYLVFACGSSVPFPGKTDYRNPTKNFT